MANWEGYCIGKWEIRLQDKSSRDSRMDKAIKAAVCALHVEHASLPSTHSASQTGSASYQHEQLNKCNLSIGRHTNEPRKNES